MKFYLASRYSRRLELCHYADCLARAGAEVTSRWLYAHDGTDEPRYAIEDIEDVRRADVVIVFTGGSTRGGYHFETGLAFAEGIPVLLVGERESIFHHLFDQFSDFDALFDHLRLVASLAYQGILVGS